MGMSDKISNAIKVFIIALIVGLFISVGAFLIKSHIIFLIGSVLSGGAFFLVMCAISLMFIVRTMDNSSL